MNLPTHSRLALLLAVCGLPACAPYTPPSIDRAHPARQADAASPHGEWNWSPESALSSPPRGGTTSDAASSTGSAADNMLVGYQRHLRRPHAAGTAGGCPFTPSCSAFARAPAYGPGGGGGALPLQAPKIT